MQRINTKGFTLIEMLVVIAIIAILATGATTVYTSSLQKARDTTRFSDLSTMKSGIEQFYQDGAVYPSLTTFSGVAVYVPVFPKDPKTGQAGAIANTGTTAADPTYLDYSYAVGPDENDVTDQVYKLSAGLENEGNVKSKAWSDGGNDEARFEIGVLGTNGAALVVKNKGAVTANSCASPSGLTSVILIKGKCN